MLILKHLLKIKKKLLSIQVSSYNSLDSEVSTICCFVSLLEYENTGVNP